MNIQNYSEKLLNGKNKLPALLILFILSVSSLAGGFAFYHAQKNRLIEDKQNELSAIASLKIKELSVWRSEHMRDARILSNSASLKEIMLEFLAGNGSEIRLKNVFLPLVEEYDYQSIFIIDLNNIVKFSTINENINLTDKPAILDKNMSDLYFSDDSSRIFMDLVIDITDNEGKSKGKLILRLDPDIVLFPLIQAWPTPSKTSETLLLRKENDSILYLNELRHIHNTALRLKLSVLDTDLPAAKVVSGYEGFFEGVDYRGVPVVSYLKKVPDSPWYMVAKVDKNEIYSPLKEQIILISLIVILALAFFGIITGFYFRSQRIKYLSEIGRTKDKFYSIISHDLRSPFVSIMGFSELLHQMSLAEDYSKAKEFTGIIYNSSVSAVELLDNLTRWTKFQTGRTFFNPLETDLKLLLKEVVETCEPAALMKSVSIRILSPDEFKAIVDRDMVATIIRNLIINAVKFSFPHSEVNILAERNNKIIQIIVSDSGIGMDKTIIDSILRMDKYDSMPGTLNEKGTGLGLFLSLEFISMHNGTLNIESEPGKGSRFTVNIPQNDRG